MFLKEANEYVKKYHSNSTSDFMNSNKKGNYYKQKTKKWLEVKGFQTCYLEHARMIFIKGKPVFFKKDEFASDILAVSRKQIIFVQVKLTSHNRSTAIKEFGKFQFPDFVDKWIIVWNRGARHPEIIEV